MLKTVHCSCVVLALFAASSGAAQEVALELTPFGGFFLPTADVAEYNGVARSQIGVQLDEAMVAAGIGGGVDVELDELTTSQKRAFMLGGRLTAWITDTFGVETGFSYIWSGAEVGFSGDLVDFFGDSARPFDESYLMAELRAAGEDVTELEEALEPEAHVWLTSLKGLYRFLPPPGRSFAIHIGGGLAVIGRGGEAFDGMSGTADLGGVLNVGATFDVSPGVALRFDAENYLYSAQFEDESSGTEITDSGLQNDLILTGGLILRLGNLQR